MREACGDRLGKQLNGVETSEGGGHARCLALSRVKIGGHLSRGACRREA